MKLPSYLFQFGPGGCQSGAENLKCQCKEWRMKLMDACGILNSLRIWFGCFGCIGICEVSNTSVKNF